MSNELTVFCSLGLAGVMAEVKPRFERASGATLAVRISTTNAFRQEIEQGAPFDVAVLTAPVIDDLIAKGRVAPGTRTDIARSCVGVTVPPGAPRPDLSSVEGFRRALLDAPSIIFTRLGASGQYFAEKLLPRLGIVQDVLRKAVIPDGGLVAERVVTGEIALGIQQVSEILAVPGAVLAGPIPEALQNYTMFSAGLGVRAVGNAQAQGLLASLADAEARALAAAKGMEPA